MSWFRSLCLLMAMVWAAPLFAWLPTDGDGCTYGCTDDASGVPCVPGCDCGCPTFAPRLPTRLSGLPAPTLAAWRDPAPGYQPRHVPDAPVRSVFHPPRRA